MRSFVYFLFLITFIWLVPGCMPVVEEEITEVNINLANPTFQTIHNFQDRQQVDSLYAFFGDRDPAIRYAAALAVGSIRAPRAIDSLAGLLKDPVEQVRIAAAFSLGQIGESAAEQDLIKSFERHDTAKVYARSNGAILEAMGKIGSEESLNLVTSISTYNAQDTFLLEGQAFSIYRYGLRGIVSNRGTEKMVELASQEKYPASVRMVAANYLMRVRNLDISPFIETLVPALSAEGDPRVRMAMVIALGKTKQEAALTALEKQLQIDNDYRVRCNIIRALGNFDYLTGQNLVLPYLEDPNSNVALTAATFFYENGTAEEARNYWLLARDSLPWEVSLKLYAAANRHLPNYFSTTKGSINYELKRRFETATNPYERAAAMKALGEFGWNYRYIHDQGFSVEAKVVRSAAIEALGRCLSMEDYRTYFGPSYRRVRQQISNYLVEAIENGDPGMSALAAGVLRQPTLFFKGTLDSLTFIDNAIASLELPREIETLQELEKTKAFLLGEPEPPLAKPEYSHPIDWGVASNIKPGTQANLETPHGTIVLELLPAVAPGTVANFVQLARSGFFDEKVFHRVVPNFVIQGGCPRGDGYGSLDYTIRSELSEIHYDQGGYVGMASAGNHTESTQFFITHSPTLHLDGNYTIFAKVAEGMDVVHRITQGDDMKISITE
ncbi:MAG: peptidylprolyl isomerase [Bacteroidota bacterium]